MRGKQQGEVPLEPVFQILRSPSHLVVWPDRHVTGLPVFMVVTGNQTVVGSGEHNIGVLRPGCNPATLASADWIPVAWADTATGTSSGDFNRGVVLLRAVRVVRKIFI